MVWKSLQGTRSNFISTTRSISPPDYFNGSGNVSHFVQKFYAAARLHQWSSREQADLILLCLNGDALRFHNTLPMAIRQDCSSVVRALLDNYARNPEDCWNDFLSKKPRIGEKTRDYANQLQNLLDVALPEAPLLTKHQLLRTAFLKVLPSSLKQSIIFSECENWDLLVQKVNKSLPLFVSCNKVSLAKDEVVQLKQEF